MIFRSLTRRVLEPPQFGIDISDLSVKVARVETKGGGMRLAAFGELEIPNGIITDGVIENEAVLAELLRRDLQTSTGEHTREQFVTASLPEEKSFVRILALPNLETRDLAHAVRWEIESAVPLPASDIYFDFEPLSSLPDETQHRNVLITAFPKTIVDGYLRVLANAGLHPLALELESQAISRAVMAADRESPSTIIIDIGANRTSFIAFSSGAVFFTKSIEVGGKDFDAAIAKELRIPVAEAREKKIAYDLDAEHRDDRVFAATKPALEKISRELTLTIDFIHGHLSPEHETIRDIEVVVLCGGDANLAGLDRYLSSRAKKPVTRADPFVNFHYPEGAIPAIPKHQSLQYTTAIGLALRGFIH